MLSDLNVNNREMELLIDLSDGFSGSDISEVCLRLRRRQFSTGELPSLKESFEVLKNLSIGEGEERRFLSQLNGASFPAVSAILRDRNVGLYSHAAIAELYGVSKATAHRWAKGEG